MYLTDWHMEGTCGAERQEALSVVIVQPPRKFANWSGTVRAKAVHQLVGVSVGSKVTRKRKLEHICW